MSSMLSILAFEEAAWEYGIWLEWKPGSTMMSCANGQKTLRKRCVVIHFPTVLEVQTVVDVHETSDIL
eukprot:11153025-Prorocentrum_lima.AAC.1